MRTRSAFGGRGTSSMARNLHDSLGAGAGPGSARARLMWGLLVAVLALAMRLAAIGHWGQPVMSETVDQAEYVVLGQNIRQHGTFSYGQPHSWGTRTKLDAEGPFEPATARAPGYPFFISLFWSGKTPPLLEVQLAQAVLGTGVALLAYAIALHAFGLPCAILAGLASALGPLSVYVTSLLLSETLFAFLLTGSVWLWSRRQGVLAGCLLGAATLTRAVVLPLIGVVLLAGLLLKGDRRRNLAMAFVAIAVVACWTGRNYVATGSFVPVATYGFGANLLVGTIDVPYGSGNTFVTYMRDPDFKRLSESGLPVPEIEREMRRVALERVVAAPLDWLLVRLKQNLRYWLATGNHLSLHPVVKYSFVAGSVLYWLLVASGMILALRRWRELYLLALFPIIVSATHFIGSAEERYSLGIVPMATVFAAYAVTRLWAWRGAPRSR